MNKGDLINEVAKVTSTKKEAKEADYFGTVSGRDMDKFKKTGLTPIKSELVDAPYIEEFPLVLECNVIHYYEIGLHTHFIGEILDVKIDDTVLTDGKADVGKVQPFTYNPDLRKYYGIGRYIGDAYDIGRSYQ